MTNNTKSITIKFIDLFAGIWSTRLWFEDACKKLWIKAKCVFTSEIKPYAVKVYEDNFKDHKVSWDITKINEKDIPDFDFLLWGFPCQAFSYAGARKGFADKRGTLFFEIERILREKNPTGFLLENVEGLVTHDWWKTFKVILDSLTALGYKVNWQVLSSKDFWVAQDRKRVYIVWRKDKETNLDFNPLPAVNFWEIQEHHQPLESSEFIENLLKHYEPDNLYGKSVKDKRWWKNNIHSWDLELKWKVSDEQKKLLNMLLKERRKKQRAEKKGIKWMDGMPLTLEEISSVVGWWLFYLDEEKLKNDLDDLVKKGYLVFEHPKKQVEFINENWIKEVKREQDPNIPKWYNIVAWKLSFPISTILDKNNVAPTIVAMDANKLRVVDGNWLRKLTITEWKRLFWIPDNFKMDVSYSQAFDLLWNTVVMPVISALSTRLLVD